MIFDRSAKKIVNIGHNHLVNVRRKITVILSPNYNRPLTSGKEKLVYTSR